MSITYTQDGVRPFGETVEPLAEESFVPRYARTGRTARGGKGKIKTWMILAPIGVVVLGGVVAALALAPREESLVSPLSEPAATAPVLPAVPATPVEVPLAPVAPPVPAPVIREVAPVPAARRAPIRRAAPVPAPRVEAPAVVPPTSSATSTLNAAPAPAPATPTPAPAPVEPPAPQIVVQPLG
jgi:hypothetical protein